MHRLLLSHLLVLPFITAQLLIDGPQPFIYPAGGENISYDTIVPLTWDNQTYLFPYVSFMVMNANGTNPTNWTYDGTFWWNSWNLLDIPNTGYYEWQIDDAPEDFAVGVKALRVYPAADGTPPSETVNVTDSYPFTIILTETLPASTASSPPSPTTSVVEPTLVQPTTEPAITTTAAPPTNRSSGPPIGLIVGPVVGGLSGLLVLAVLAFLFKKKGGKLVKKAPDDDMDIPLVVIQAKTKK